MSRVRVETITGCSLIRFEPYEDHRGYFYESFNHEISEIVGFWPKQENVSKSSKNVVRGLHLQHTPPASKLIRVLTGKIQDVAVDCRKNSRTYGKHASVVLDSSTPHWFHVPMGYAHGFCVLSDYAIVNYYVSETYSPLGEVSIDPFTKSLEINWLIQKKDAILSEKDKNAIRFEDYSA